MKGFWVRGAMIALTVFFLVLPKCPASARRDTGLVSRMKSCMANLRVLAGAVEMYNMDNDKTMMRVLRLELLTGTNGYLKATPKCPDAGVYSGRGDLSTESGRVACSTHGTVDDATAFVEAYNRNQSLKKHMMIGLMFGGVLAFFVVRKVWMADARKAGSD